MVYGVLLRARCSRGVNAGCLSVAEQFCRGPFSAWFLPCLLTRVAVPNNYALLTHRRRYGAVFWLLCRLTARYFAYLPLPPRRHITCRNVLRLSLRRAARITVSASTPMGSSTGSYRLVFCLRCTGYHTVCRGRALISTRPVYAWNRGVVHVRWITRFERCRCRHTPLLHTLLLITVLLTALRTALSLFPALITRPSLNRWTHAAQRARFVTAAACARRQRICSCPANAAVTTFRYTCFIAGRLYRSTPQHTFCNTTGCARLWLPFAAHFNS